jgi:NAD(P)-dependent dehydrogenase (short-subunit alcohol dehydrogenase family)
MARLSGKIALITGGTSGMGAATAKLFQEEGATVIVTGSSDQSVAAAKKALPSVQAIRSDAGDPQAAKQLVEAVAREHGRIDILFVNAGIARVAPATATTEDLFDTLFATNV